MMKLTLRLAVCLAGILTTAMGQTYDNDRYRPWGENDADYVHDRYEGDQGVYSPYTDRLFRQPVQSLNDRMRHEMLRLRDGYDYQAPLGSAVEDRFRAPIDERRLNRGYSEGDSIRMYRGYSGSESLRGDSGRRSLPNPFQWPSMDDFRRSPGGQSPMTRPRSWETQRPGYVPVDYSNFDRDYRPVRPNDGSGFSRPVPTDRRFESVPDYSQPSSRDRGLDPYVPALPRRENGSEADAIFKVITERYSDPAGIRAVQAMSGSQAIALYREVSQQTDRRHLEPSSYDLRVRRGLRNLALAIDNPSFQRAFRLSNSSFRMDGFRDQLSRLSDRIQVRSASDAESVVQSVMSQAQAAGIPANVVAWEFANATVDTLDKFSALEPKEPGRGAALEQESQSAMLEGEIVGVGVELKVHDNGLLVMKALRGGPAAEAGLQSGDIITAIDGRSIRGMKLAGSVDLMKGSSGTRVRLTIHRNGVRAGTVTLTRRRVRIYTVNDVRMIRGTDRVAYISLSQFGQRSTEELDQALREMHGQGMQSLVLDLRGNPGGLLNVCVDITNRFLPCGTIVSTRGRLANDNMREVASYSRTWKVPLVVLIDNDSASASEIFAAAVQDNRRGVVVGERSYGKGTVQTHFPLQTVNGSLRLTTARFYSPNGRPMSGQGVTPDVQIADADGPANGDRVLQEALQIAQSQRLRDIANESAKCRNRTSSTSPDKKVQSNIYDSVLPETVIQ